MSSQETLVSIIIPTYNRAHLIGETLDSVLAQTYQSWECLVIDDGSTDTTEAVVKLYVDKDARFHYYKRPNTHLPGGNGARNYGFELSKGDYIQWFDDDDIMFNTLLEDKVLAFNTNKDLGAILSGFEINKNGKDEKKVYDFKFCDDLLSIAFIKNINLNMQSFFFKREVVNTIKFNETLVRAQDLDFVFRVFANAKIKVLNLNKVHIYIRLHKESITGRYKTPSKKAIESELAVFKPIMNHYYKKDVMNYNVILDHFLEHNLEIYNNGFKHLSIKSILFNAYVSTGLRIELSFYLILSLISYRGKLLFINRIDSLRLREHNNI